MTKHAIPNRSIDPRSPEEQEASLQALARRCGIPVEEARRLEAGLRALPLDEFLDGIFGEGHAAFYDAGEDLWIVPDRAHRGPGFGFIAIRSDRSWFRGVVPAEVFQ